MNPSVSAVGARSTESDDRRVHATATKLTGERQLARQAFFAIVAEFMIANYSPSRPATPCSAFSPSQCSTGAHRPVMPQVHLRNIT